MNTKTFIKIIIGMVIAVAILTGIALINNEILNSITFYGVLIAVAPMFLSAYYFNRYSTGRYWYIFKGWSYSNLIYYIPFFNKYEFTFYFSIFSQNFISDTDLDGKPNDEKVQLRNQINKLCGASFGGIHDNSIRLGFNWEKNDPNSVQVFNYTYNNGKRVLDAKTGREPYMGDIKMDLVYQCIVRLDRANNKAIVIVAENVSGKVILESSVDVDASAFKKNGRMSMPYVENNPKKMKFSVDYLRNK